MMRMGVGMTDVMIGAASGLMCGVANRLMCAGVSSPMSAGVSGRTRAVTGIVVAGPTHALAMAPITCCRTANAGLTFDAEQTRLMSER